MTTNKSVFYQDVEQDLIAGLLNSLQKLMKLLPILVSR